MKQWTYLRLVLLALVLTGVEACHRAEPVYQVSDHPIPAATQKLPLEEIEQNIIRAGAKRRWRMEPVAPGQLLARYSDNKHEAVVDIRFSQTKYSIDLNSTHNLKQRDETIHKTFNRWIRNLETDIDDQLYRAGLERR